MVWDVDAGPHPLLPVLLAAAEGDFPPVDGAADLLPPLRADLQAVVSFTGHAFVATSRAPQELARFGLDGYGAALGPAVLQHLAGPAGQVGVLDVTLCARGLGGSDLTVRTDLDDHPRVRHARSVRRAVRVFGDDRGLVTLARGLAGRTELSVEVVPDRQGRGVGRSLVRDALGLVPRGEPVFAAVSPGNARSLRALLACGFSPLGSEVLLLGP